MPQTKQARSPSPQGDGLGSMDHLLPDKPRRPRSVPWSTRIYQLIGSPDTTGKEELVVVGLLAFMLLAGVVVGTVMLPRDSEHGRMAALKVKYSIPTSYIVSTTTTTTTRPTTTKNAAKTKAPHHTRRNEKGAPKRAEEEDEADDAEETTTPTVEEENESDSKKKRKARRKPKTINKSARSPRRHARAPV